MRAQGRRRGTRTPRGRPLSRAELTFASIAVGGVVVLAGAPTAGGQVVRDSAGLRIVENARPTAGGEGPFATVGAVATLEIGVVERAYPPSGPWETVGGVRRLFVFLDSPPPPWSPQREARRDTRRVL